jgi:hypothetical protein
MWKEAVVVYVRYPGIAWKDLKKPQQTIARLPGVLAAI